MAEPATEPRVELDGQYRALREEAGIVDRAARGKLLVRGDDAAEFLQGQITNDIEALSPGDGCYAALLDRKGHMQADMRVLRLAGNQLWIDTEPEPLKRVFRHLDTYRIGRQVEIEDHGAERAILSLAGPAAGKLVDAAPSPEHAHREQELDGIPVRAVATDLGVDLICASTDREQLVERLVGRGAVEVSEGAAEILRVESGRPRFGVDMDESTIPEEAGINERAVSFTKGCYIGQETVARLHYKGKPNRHLRGLRLSAPAVGGESLGLEEREVGRIGTACVSPALGPIALAIVRREAGPGDALRVGDSDLTAEVLELPFA